MTAAAVDARKREPGLSVQKPTLRRPLDSLDTPTQRGRRLSWFGLLVALALPVTAYAGTDRPNPSSLMSHMAAAACSAARLDPGEAPFANCVRSLKQLSVSTITPMRRSQAACAALGLAPGSAPYATCVANVMATFDQARELGS